ncbi:unnamed protein product [Blepharisma stoltei]|uniref:F-box domain-containing protein n=1 Tax=Blepharisma stoltei TaxID=1481888 RepID=A0AAU9IPY5_9CILI|nr:unnamed protein product [Blepharisma stoltei]
MESKKPNFNLLVRYQNNKDNKCSIFLLGANMIREIISFLTFQEYLNFTMTCKKFWKYVYDPHVSIHDKHHQLDKVNTLFNGDDVGTSLIESILEANLSTGKLPSVALKWSKCPSIIFHYLSYKQEHLFFGYEDNNILVFSISSFRNDFTRKETWICQDRIIAAAGHKNRIVCSSGGNLELFSYGPDPSLEYFPDINCSRLTKQDDRKKPILKIEYFNNGQHIICLKKYEAVLFNRQLEKLRAMKFEESKTMISHSYLKSDNYLNLHIPNPAANAFFIHYENIIKFYNANQSIPANEIQITTKVTCLKSTKYETPDGYQHSVVLFLDGNNQLYKNKTKLNVFCHNGFAVIKEYIIFQDGRSNNFVIFNIATSTYHSVEDQWSFRCLNFQYFIDVSPFKIMYISKSERASDKLIKVHLQRYSDSQPIILNTPFGRLLNCTYSHPFLVLAGIRYSAYGIMTVNIYSAIPATAYYQTINSFLPPKLSRPKEDD